MKCFKCDVHFKTDSKSLQCIECGNWFHIECEGNITHRDYDFIKSEQVNWKCCRCGNKKLHRNDDTPVKTSVAKQADVSSKETVRKETETDSDSSVSLSSGVTRKNLCGKCNKGYSYNSHRAQCNYCNNTFHLKCITISKASYAVGKPWLCPVCSRTTAATQPVEITLKPQDRTEQDRAGQYKNKQMDDDLSPQPDSQNMIGQLMTEMVAFRSEIRQANKEMTESLNKYADWIVENGNKIEEVSGKLNTVLLEIDSVRQENVNLKKEVVNLKGRLDVLEQAARDNVLEIQGVPYQKNENLTEILKNISVAIDFAFEVNMIDKCYRLRSFVGDKSRPGTVIVKFVRSIDKHLFIQKRKFKRNLNSRDLGFMEGDSSLIYINSSLTPVKRKLLRDARQVRRDKQYTFIWVDNGRIFLRKKEGDPRIEIRYEEDLNLL